MTNPYIERETQHLKDILKAIKDPDFEIKFIQSKHNLAWGILYCKSRNAILSISFSGISGVDVCYRLKPTKFYGSGYSCIEPGFNTINKHDIYRVCCMGERLLLKDAASFPENQGKPFIRTKDYKYESLDEYIQTYKDKTDLTIKTI